MSQRRIGSPPQVRGKRFSIFFASLADRITPAGAGKTTTHGTLNEQDGDHPRRCGENTVTITEAENGEGSPPQVRGKQRSIKSPPEHCRITPAGAGKTIRDFNGVPFNEDHPRRCGENAKQRRKKNERKGSPPQVRGKLGIPMRRGTGTRITPAGAGKTAFF